MAISQTIIDGYPWYYYIRAEEGNFHIGVVDKNGDPISTAGESIVVYFTGAIADLTGDSDTFFIPRSAEIAFAKGIAHSILDSEGINKREYEKAFDGLLAKMKNKKLKMSATPRTVRVIQITP